MKFKVYSAAASVMGIGYLPMAPGTWASLAAAALWLVFQNYFPGFDRMQWTLVIACIIIGIVSSDYLIKHWGNDPSQIVIDELAGMWIACLLLPHQWKVILTAFVLFRFFDIVKPLGIKKMEKLKGGLGVMMDDVLAGIYSNLCLQGLMLTGIWKN